MLRHSGYLQRCGAILIFLMSTAIASAEELTLRDEALAHTIEGRQYLKYLVSCALPEKVNVVTTVDQVRFVFPGLMGLAPQWSKQPLSLTEQRRVSACILARTNFYGKPVLVSLRGNESTLPDSVKANRKDRRAFPFYEAGFFGNIFLEQPVAYVCGPTLTHKRKQYLESSFRVCSFPAEPAVTNANGQAVSRCQFIMVGPCYRANFRQAGINYTPDVLKVYLAGPQQLQTSRDKQPVATKK